MFVRQTLQVTSEGVQEISELEKTAFPHAVIETTLTEPKAVSILSLTSK